ncbi:DNA adenine methylase [Gilliamella sp. App2-1]|uniref:DNA adenine methylase n=1 Tax=Gilliamella sp. App2-1 TaxID=3120230 RepID=UPI0009E6496B|nr:Dam family site-specific DNA-(adenine-N6)-methyltransferase [Gilliamella apicola]
MNIKKSFLKWPGGKGRIIELLLSYLPTNGRFIEPFVGAGNVFINVDAKSYILTDSNSDLINVYRWLKSDATILINETKALFDSEVDFYELRNQFNLSSKRHTLEQAAKFIWLNRHCFNGLCRYNRNGNFNVPKGKHSNTYFPEQELINFSKKLCDTDVLLTACDFRTTITKAESNDIIYCDPPYLGPFNGSFVGYTSNSFDYIKTQELEKCLFDAVKRGAIAIISNSDNPITQEIFNKFNIHSIESPRSIAANGNRKPAKEIIGVLTPEMINNSQQKDLTK